MSDEEQNVLEFPTSANQPVDTSPEGLEDIAAKGGAQVLALVNKNRKKGVEALERAIEKGEALGDDNYLLDACKAALISLEATNSVIDMLIHDLAGCIHNLEQQQAAMWQIGAQTQVLIEVLKEKGVITTEDLQTVFNKIVPSAIEELKEKVNREGS
jgi:hypothetical protein